MTNVLEAVFLSRYVALVTPERVSDAEELGVVIPVFTAKVTELESVFISVKLNAVSTAIPPVAVSRAVPVGSVKVKPTPEARMMPVKTSAPVKVTVAALDVGVACVVNCTPVALYTARAFPSPSDSTM